MNGIVNINKPDHMTSHDAIAIMRGVLRTKKIGHSGTLDPMATGVLNLFIGRSTKFIELIKSEKKVYKAKLIFGYESETLDIWGQQLKEIPFETPKEEIIKETLLGFVGVYDQVPPMYSAKKVNGRKLYELAREGIIVERPSSKVKIFGVDDIHIDGDEVEFTLTCSRGTYVRSLIDDFSKKIATPAVMNSLTRVENEGIHLKDTYTIDQVKEMLNSNDLSFLTPLESLMGHLPTVDLDDQLYKFVKNGVKIDLEKFTKVHSMEYALKHKGEFIGLAVREDNMVKSKKLI